MRYAEAAQASSEPEGGRRSTEEGSSWPGGEARPQQDAGEPSARLPLPRALWGQPLTRYSMSLAEHNVLTQSIKKILSQVLKTNDYNSVNNFILFHEEYLKSNVPFIDFYDSYHPPIVPYRHTCVGLGLELIRRMEVLDREHRGLSKATSLLSCEEAVKNIRHYVTSATGPHEFPHVSAEKEHVMVGVRILVDGREGVMIADPGYHVGRVVTVMNDELYPHTGLFVQHDSELMVKEYDYSVNSINKDYVEWHEREYKNGRYKYQISLVYIGRPYLTAIEVTEKRNIVYTFKSQLRRDSRGNIIAGYYFPLAPDLETATFTVFVGLQAKAKYKFSDFIDINNIDPILVENFKLICSFMNCSHWHVIEMICKLANIYTDTDFIENVINLNNLIRHVCKSREAIGPAADQAGGSDVDTDRELSPSQNSIFSEYLFSLNNAEHDEVNSNLTEDTDLISDFSSEESSDLEIEGALGFDNDHAEDNTDRDLRTKPTVRDSIDNSDKAAVDTAVVATTVGDAALEETVVVASTVIEVQSGPSLILDVTEEIPWYASIDEFSDENVDDTQSTAVVTDHCE